MKTIMLVDDVEISNYIHKKIIANNSAPSKVFAFTDPAKALQSLEEINPDIIFLDLNMPVIDGWKFLDILKETDKTCGVYILTSSTSELDKQRSVDYANVINFLIKPVTPAKISEILNSVII